MTTTPDGISFSDLQEHLKDAPKESAIVKTEGEFNGFTKEQVFDITNDYLQQLADKLGHPIAHKLALALILDNMIDWHTRIGNKMIEDGETESAVAWLRDAGKFQAASNITSNVSICDGDFTCVVE